MRGDQRSAMNWSISYFYRPDNCPKCAAVKRRMHENGHRIAALADQPHVITLLSLTCR